MNLQITGVVTTILPTTQGTSASGNAWAKQQFVLTTQEQYPKTICFTVFGQDKIDQIALKQNEQVTVSFDLKSREYNGRYYTDVNAWNVERVGGQQQGSAPQQQTPMAAMQQAQNQQMQQMASAPFPQAAQQGANGGNNDLPF